MKKILSIDGGGMKGFIPCSLLVELERRTGKLCCEMFDGFAGSSVGAIVILLLAIGVPAHEALKFFTEDGPKIFQKSARGFWGLFGAKYSSAAIEILLRQRFEGHKMSDVPGGLLVTSLDLVSQQPFFFKSISTAKSKFPCLLDEDFYLWEVARATSAAQSYFPAFPLDDKILWDGGNVANNPSLCVYCEARQWWPGEEIMVVSLGTGSQNADIKPKSLVNATLISVGLATLQMLFEAGSEDVDYQMKELLGQSYMRINPALQEPLAMDDASIVGLNKLRAEAAFAVKQFEPQLTALTQLLLATDGHG